MVMLAQQALRVLLALTELGVRVVIQMRPTLLALLGLRAETVVLAAQALMAGMGILHSSQELLRA